MTSFRTFSGLLILLLASITLTGCDAFSSDDDDSGLVTLTGQILNRNTNNPVPNAFVVVMPQNLMFEADSLGAFDFDVRVDSTMDLQASRSAATDSSTCAACECMAPRVAACPARHPGSPPRAGSEVGSDARVRVPCGSRRGTAAWRRARIARPLTRPPAGAFSEGVARQVLRTWAQGGVRGQVVGSSP